MSSSFFSYLKEDHQSITIENALIHLDLIDTIKSHCKPNADLKDLILDFEERREGEQVKEWELNVIEIYIELRCELEKGTLEFLDSKRETLILNTRLDPATWHDWITTKKMFLTNGLVFKPKELQSLYDDMGEGLAKLKILYPDRYKEDDISVDERLPDYLEKDHRYITTENIFNHFLGEDIFKDIKSKMNFSNEFKPPIKLKSFLKCDIEDLSDKEEQYTKFCRFFFESTAYSDAKSKCSHETVPLKVKHHALDYYDWILSKRNLIHTIIIQELFIRDALDDILITIHRIPALEAEYKKRQKITQPSKKKPRAKSTEAKVHKTVTKLLSNDKNLTARDIQQHCEILIHFDHDKSVEAMRELLSDSIEFKTRFKITPNTLYNWVRKAKNQYFVK